MKGKKSIDTTVVVQAGDVWELYRGIGLGRVVNELLGDAVGKVEVVQGDGSIGTILKVTFPPGKGFSKEIFRVADDENRVKVSQVIEGAFLEMGFGMFIFRIEIIEKDRESSIIRSIVEYEMDDSKSELASLVPLESMEIIAQAVEKYFIQKPSTP